MIAFRICLLVEVTSQNYQIQAAHLGVSWGVSIMRAFRALLSPQNLTNTIASEITHKNVRMHQLLIMFPKQLSAPVFCTMQELGRYAFTSR